MGIPLAALRLKIIQSHRLSLRDEFTFPILVLGCYAEISVIMLFKNDANQTLDFGCLGQSLGIIA